MTKKKKKKQTYAPTEGKFHLREDDLRASLATSLIEKIDALELKKISGIKSVQIEEDYSICDMMGYTLRECLIIFAFNKFCLIKWMP